MAKKRMKILKEVDLYIKGCGIIDLPCPMAAFGDGPVILQDQVVLPNEEYLRMGDTIVRLSDQVSELQKSLKSVYKLYEDLRDGYNVMQQSMELLLDNSKGQVT